MVTTAYGGVSLMASAVFGRRLSSSRYSALSSVPPCSIASCSSTSFRYLSGASRLSFHQIRASSSEDTPSTFEVGEVFSDLKEKWDALENKSTILLYGGGAIVTVWLSSTVVGAINSVPLLPKIMELVGLGYTGWFVYRYLLFKSSRKELASDIETLKKKIAGGE